MTLLQASKKPTRIAVLGLGAIGRTVLDRLLLRGASDAPPTLLAYVKAYQMDGIEAHYGKQIQLTTSIDGLIEFAPDVVVEAAGQSAVRDLAQSILEARLNLMLVSTGALAETELRSRLTRAAARSGARIFIPAGAIAGLDGLGALRYSSDLRVRYVSVKPPAAWRDTPAEDVINLDTVDQAATFFKGSAAEAATRFPRNANLAATIAIAGAGFERTTIELVADPTVTGPRGYIEAEGELGRLVVDMSGPSMATNAKTSAVTAFSLLHALENMERTIVI